MYTAPALPLILRLATSNGMRYGFSSVIKSFRNRDTERVFQRERSTKLPPDIQRPALRKLRILDAATSLNDLKVPPGNCLEKLSRDRSGQHSIRINQQWRICFRWAGTDAYDVEIVDYH